MNPKKHNPQNLKIRLDALILNAQARQEVATQSLFSKAEIVTASNMNSLFNGALAVNSLLWSSVERAASLIKPADAATFAPVGTGE